MNIPKQQSKRCPWMPVEKKMLHDNQINGKANAGDGGARMDKKPVHKWHLWVKWPWMMFHVLSGNCQLDSLSHRTESKCCFYNVKTHLHCSSCLSKGYYVPKVAPIPMPRPLERTVRSFQRTGSNRVEKTLQATSCSRHRANACKSSDTVPPWWEGWCWWRRKNVWEGGTKRNE